MSMNDEDLAYVIFATRDNATIAINPARVAFVKQMASTDPVQVWFSALEDDYVELFNEDMMHVLAKLSQRMK